VVEEGVRWVGCAGERNASPRTGRESSVNCTGDGLRVGRVMVVYESLARPPLIEAVCEFRFAPSDEWDWTIPGRLYDRIQGEFPRREQVQGIGFTLQIGEGPQPTVPAVQGGVDRVMMSREDGSAVVQVGPNQIVVNHKLPYPGWNRFYELIERILGMYLDLAPSTPPQRVGLRYINQIPRPSEESVDIGALITLDPPIPPKIDCPLNNFYQRYELIHKDPAGLLVHQTGMQMTQDRSGVLVLDLDFGSLPTSLPSIAQVGRWLHAAHDRVEEAFQASVNPDLLERMRRGDQ
jgi:uncharacterized protein (TIGR04255 family)